jgi:hypothetical protein
LLKDNLGVKLGTAYAVWPVANIILTTMVKAKTNPDFGLQPASAVTGQMGIELSKLALISNNSWLLISVLVVGILWTAAILTRAGYRFVKFDNPYLFKFGQCGWMFALIAQILVGVSLVPFVIIWALLIHVSGVAEEVTLTSAVTFTAAYIFLLGAMHYLASIEKEITNSVIYVVQAPSSDVRSASLFMLDEINNARNELAWIGSPEVIFVSNDGVVVLTLPILYAAKKLES